MALLAAPPDVLRWSPRSTGHGDCAVAAIELACGVTYEVALAACLTAAPKVLTQGLYWAEIKRAVKALGFRYHLRRRYDLDEDTGILGVQQPANEASDHAVYLWQGRILEPSDDRRQLWLSAQEFITHYRYEHTGLLVVEASEET